MLPLLSALLAPKSDEAEIAWQLSHLLGVRISYTAIKKNLEEHPSYPSMLSISDVLDHFGIDNVTAIFEKERLITITTPFITLITGKTLRFTVVQSITDTTVRFFNLEKRTWDTENKHTFLNRCSGIALLAQASAHAGEKTYDKSVRQEKKTRNIQYGMLSVIPLILLLTGLTAFFAQGAAILLPWLFTALLFSGCFISVLLLWYEIDQFNPALQQICSAGKKTSCSAVLASGGASVAGTSWSVIGFSYFTGSLLLLLTTGLTNAPVLMGLSWLSILALPYTLYSLYYQWKVAQQWCLLCLSVQAVLVLTAVVTFIGGWRGLSLPANSWPGLLWQITAAFAIPWLVVYLLMPALKKAKAATEHKMALYRLKHDPRIFAALLQQQKKITTHPEGLGIQLGNPTAANKIIKVCNPYCSPCAQAHGPLEELLEQHPDLQAQIIFTASNDEQDIKALPVKHLMAVAAQSVEQATKQALDDWYLAEQKDYELFAGKHPLPAATLAAQGHQLTAMREWCNKTNIEFTPTFFINGHQLPPMYTIEDIRHYLSV